MIPPVLPRDAVAARALACYEAAGRPAVAATELFTLATGAERPGRVVPAGRSHRCTLEEQEALAPLSLAQLEAAASGEAAAGIGRLRVLNG